MDLLSNLLINIDLKFLVRGGLDNLWKRARKQKRLKFEFSPFLFNKLQAKEIEEMRIHGVLQFVSLKKLNRIGHFRCKKVREVTNEVNYNFSRWKALGWNNNQVLTSIIIIMLMWFFSSHIGNFDVRFTLISDLLFYGHLNKTKPRRHAPWQKCPSLWLCGIGSHLGWNRLWVRFLAVYIPRSLSLRLLGSLRGSLGTYGLTQKLCLKKHKSVQDKNAADKTLQY